MSPADEKGYYARSTYARSVVPDHMSSMGSPRTPIYTAPSMPPTVYHPHYTPEDIRAALEQRAKQSSRSRSRSRAPSRAGSEIQGPRYVDRFDDTRSMRSASRGRLLDERDRRMLEERSRGSWMEHEAVSPAVSWLVA